MHTTLRLKATSVLCLSISFSRQLDADSAAAADDVDDDDDVMCIKPPAH